MKAVYGLLEMNLDAMKLKSEKFLKATPSVQSQTKENKLFISTESDNTSADKSNQKKIVETDPIKIHLKEHVNLKHRHFKKKRETSLEKSAKTKLTSIEVIYGANFSNAKNTNS